MKLRQEDKLQKGEKIIQWVSPADGLTYSFNYEGELMNGLAHGSGKMKNNTMHA